MVKQTEIFWIQFAELYCKVTATSGMKAFFHKYFSGSYVTFFDNNPKTSAQTAELIVCQKPSESSKTSVVIKNDKLRFSMLINGLPHFYYPLLTNVLHRIFTASCFYNGGIVFHASSVESRGKAYVFVGESGKGKTTVARLSSDLYGMRVLADNQVFIRKNRGKYLVYPFPFTQYNKDAKIACLPIASFYLLHQSAAFAVKSLSFIESVRALENEIQVHIADDAPMNDPHQLMLRRTIFDFAKSVTIKRLHFLPGKGLWEAIYNAS